MKAFSLALAFVRIPQFFLSLLLGPLFIGSIIVGGQVIMLNAYTLQGSKNSETIKSRIENDVTGRTARLLLYANKQQLPALKTCRWLTDSPPPTDCSTLSYDVAIWVDEPEAFDAIPFEKLFSGMTRQLHICRKCRGDIIIDARNGARETHILSVFAILVLIVSREQSPEIHNLIVSLWERRDEIKNLLGKQIIHLPGTKKEVDLSSLNNDIMIIMNVVILVVVTLWLALRSHRKVLDYLAKSGALLPLVAANGKKAFYLSIWLITLLRVLLFLGSSVPITCFFIMDMMNTEGVNTSLTLRNSQLGLWLFGLVSSLTLLTLLGSIAELKHRRLSHSFFFKYVPIIVCILGGVIWSASLALSGSTISIIRTVIATLPITGLLPLLLAPLFSFEDNIIVAHIILASTAAVFLMFKNARWFAAHLDEL